MKLFVSWSGEYSRAVGELLRKYLPCMLQGLNVFVSQHDIESGARWTLRLAQELEESNFGILCLARDNLTSPWLLYEAGALTKHIDGRAAGLLLGDLRPSEVAGPLSQFQHRTFSRDDLSHLLMDLNKKMATPLEGEQVDLIFKKWWPDLESDYKAVKVTPKTITRRDDSEILAEVLERVRNVERVMEQEPSSEVFMRTPRGFVTPEVISAFVRDVLEGVTPAQRQLLGVIARNKKTGNEEGVNAAVALAVPADLEALIARGLLKRSEDGAVRIHRFVIDAFNIY